MPLPADPMIIDKKNAGEWLKGLREQAGIARGDLPPIVGRDYRTLMNIENGRGPEGTVVLLRYLKVIGVLPDAPVTLPNLGRLAELEALVAQLPTREELQQGLALLQGAIESQAKRDTHPAKGRSTRR